MTRKLRWILSFLLLGLLAGCRSQQVAFRFSPPHRVAYTDSSTVATVAAVPAPLPRDSAPAAPALRHPVIGPRAKMRRPLMPLMTLRQASVQAAVRIMAPAKRLRASAVAPAAVGEQRSSLERNALFIGLILSLLGLGLLIGVGSQTFAAASLLLEIAHVLLVAGSLVMALWFVLLVLRASKEV